MFRRKINSKYMEDSQTIENIEYSPFSAAQKNLEVGPALVYIGDASAELIVTPGDQLFFFKTTTGLGWVKMSSSSGIGAVPTAPSADTFPIEGQVFTRYSAALYKYIKATSDVHLYVLRDDNQERNNP